MKTHFKTVFFNYREIYVEDNLKVQTNIYMCAQNNSKVPFILAIKWVLNPIGEFIAQQSRELKKLVENRKYKRGFMPQNISTLTVDIFVFPF